MSQPTLDERVAALEHEVAELRKSQVPDGRSAEKDWRSTMGMFAGDDVVKEIIGKGRKIRERDRDQTRG
jgi:hypothetical protein